MATGSLGSCHLILLIGSQQNTSAMITPHPTGNVSDGLSWWDHLGLADKAHDQKLQQLDAIVVDITACSDGIPAGQGHAQKKMVAKPAQHPVKLSAVHMMQDWELCRSKNLQHPTVWSPRVPSELMEPLQCSVGRRDDALMMAQEKELSQMTNRPLTKDNVSSVGRLTVTAIKSSLVERSQEGQHHPCWKKAALVSVITLTILNAEDGMQEEILHHIESCHGNKNGQHIPCTGKQANAVQMMPSLERWQETHWKRSKKPVAAIWL